jgi:hypothetical protein
LRFPLPVLFSGTGVYMASETTQVAKQAELLCSADNLKQTERKKNQMETTKQLLDGFIAAERLVTKLRLDVVGNHFAWEKLWNVCFHVQQAQKQLGADYFKADE